MKKHLLTIALAAATITASAQGWQDQNSNLPPVVSVISFSIVDANNVWAAGQDVSGNSAAVQAYTKTTNGGKTWTRGYVTGAKGYSFSNIEGISADLAFAAMFRPGATGGAIFKTTNGGAQWSKITSGSIFTNAASFPNMVHMYNANEGWAMGDPVGGYFEVYTTTDGGTTWSARIPKASFTGATTLASGEFGITDLYSSVGDVAWFGTNKGKVFKTTDKGKTWIGYKVVDQNNSTIAAASVQNVVFKDANNGLISTDGDSVYTTADGGATWKFMETDGPFFGFDVCYVPGTPNTYVSGNNQGTSMSVDGGKTWVLIDAVQHFGVKFKDIDHGWSGNVVDAADTTVNGMYFYGVAAGIAENAIRNGGVSVYPNPSVDGIFNIATYGVDNKELSVKVYDVTGRLVSQLHEEVATGKFNRTLDLSANVAGVYFAEVKIGNKVTTQKLVIQ